MSTEESQSFFQHLWDRKLPQYLGTYLAVGFGLLQFLTFITTRYNLRSSLIEKYLLVWLLLLPAIATLIYFKGKLQPTNNAGVIRWPKYLVITNVALALMLGGFMFNGSVKAEKSESETITLTDEQGKEITHVVPSLNKVQTIACFRFENLTGDDDQDWWGMAFSDLLMYDLEQRPEFYVKSEFHLHDHYERMGLESFILPNVGKQREIAQKSRSDYFTRISYTKENDEYKMKGKLYSSRDGKSIMELSAEDADPYAAIDKLKQQITENMPDAMETVESQVSLPTSSLLTSNPEALKHYTLSQISFSKDVNALTEFFDLGKEAIELDPTCAMCHLNLGSALYLDGKSDEAVTYVKNAIKYGESLPERMQFFPKEILYAVTNKIDAYFKLQEVRRKMFPFEFRSYQTLLSKYKGDYGLDSAKVLMNEAIDNGNIEKGLLALYELQLEGEEYSEAEKTLDRFSKEFPDREQDRIKYADIFEKQGKIKEAKDILLEAETMDPINTTIQTKLAYLDFKSQDIPGAMQRVNQGIAQATTLSDSTDFMWIKSYFLSMTGQIKGAFNVLQDYQKHSLKQVPISNLNYTLFMPKSMMYYAIDQSDKIEILIDELNKISPDNAKSYRCNSLAQALIGDYEPTISSEDFSDCHSIFEKFGEGYAYYIDVLKYYKEGNLEKCIEILDDQPYLKDNIFTNNYFIASIYFKGGQKQKAKELLSKTIQQEPGEPMNYFKMAEILEGEDKTQAKEYLDIAMEYWSNADADFIPAQRARDLANILDQ